jgi:hypothetical protein
MRNSSASPRMQMLPTIAAVVVSAWVGAIVPAAAQSKGAQQAVPPQPPRVIILPNDIYRGPPAPQERYVAPPRSSQEISPPMPRSEPLPQMAPRVGN